MIWSVQKLHDDLDFWIHIGIGNDIIDLKDQRKEYGQLIDKARNISHDDREIPKIVLKMLEHELKQNIFKRETFWFLVRLNFMTVLKRVKHGRLKF